MKRIYPFCLLIFFFAMNISLYAQDSAAFNWNVQSKKISDGVYELQFKTSIKNGWQLYAPNQAISDVHTVETSFADSSIKADTVYKEAGTAKQIASKIFDNASFKVYENEAEIIATVKIKGTVPENLIGKFKYSFGKNDEFYPLTDYSFSVKLEGGVASVARIKINSFDLKHPVNNCGDDGTEGKGLASIFFIRVDRRIYCVAHPMCVPSDPAHCFIFYETSW